MEATAARGRVEGLATEEDRGLIAACIAGAAGAWDRFILRFGGLFGHIAERTAAQRSRPFSGADRDDVVAEILLACVRDDAAALRAYAGRASLPTYLTVIARRITVRWLLRKAAAGMPVGACREVVARSSGRAAAAREEIEALLGRLDDRERLLVRLHHLEARSYGEISQLTGIPLGSIGPVLSRAKAKMRVPIAG